MPQKGTARRGGTAGGRPSRAGAALRLLDPRDLLAAAARGEAPPVVLVTGQDSFTRDAVLKELRATMVPEGTEAFNDVTMSGDEVSGEDVLGQAEMMPFMMGPGAGQRLIVVRRADRMKEKDAEAIAGYAASPSRSACLVLVCDQAKGPVVNAAKQVAARLEFPAPRDYQLARWLQAQAQRLEVAIDADAAAGLAGMMGENYIGAMSELQRAALAAGSDSGKTSQKGAGRGGPRITRRLIEELGGRGRDTNPFHLGDAILSRDPARGVRILRDYLDAGGTGFVLLGSLESQLRRFLAMRARVEAGEPPRDVVQAASPTLPPDVKARLVRQVESFTEAKLMEAFRLVRRADRAIKGHGSGSEAAHLEALVWGICAL